MEKFVKTEGVHIKRNDFSEIRQILDEINFGRILGLQIRLWLNGPIGSWPPSFELSSLGNIFRICIFAQATTLRGG